MSNTVTQPVADIHRSPDPESEVVTQALYAHPVEPVEVSDSWTRVQTADKYEGWLSNAALGERRPPTGSVTGVAQVETLWTHLFKTPDTTPHPPQLTLSFETTLPVATPPPEWSDRWIEVYLLDGSKAWIQSGDLRLNPSPRTLSQVLDLAYKFIGLPYRWGGCSGFGYDCSGFVQMLYRQMGYRLPRDASQQAAVEDGKEVSSADAGDLLFFANPGQGISHVGMAVDDTRFIHAVTTGDGGPRAIQISSVHTPEWRTRLVATRRYPLTYSHSIVPGGFEVTS